VVAFSLTDGVVVVSVLFVVLAYLFGLLWSVSSSAPCQHTLGVVLLVLS
jgi:hypothetical protein